MKSEAIIGVVSYNMNLEEAELSELYRIVNTYLLVHRDDVNAQAFSKSFEKLLYPKGHKCVCKPNSDCPGAKQDVYGYVGNDKENVEEDTSHIFFYDTYNMRVEEDDGHIPLRPSFDDEENFRFIWRGKQLGIEYWDSYKVNTQPSSKVWFNTPCCLLIVDFLKSEGKSIGSYGNSNSLYRYDGGYRTDIYLDNKGHISESKNMMFDYNIKKECANLPLNKYQTKKLKEFLLYHLDLL